MWSGDPPSGTSVTFKRKIRGKLTPIALLIVASCRSPSSETERKSEIRAPAGSVSGGANVASAGASKILGTLRRRFTSHSAPNDPGAAASRPEVLLQKGLADAFRVADGKLVPDFATREPEALGVTLPKRSASFVELVDRASSTRVTVSYAKAHDVEALTADGYAVYPGAHESGATVIYAPRPDGFEDYVSFENRPSTPVVMYELGLSHGVGGLRLVENTLEILDALGAPRFRATPPFVLGADGHLTDATLSVEGCAVDKSPAPPWDRPLTPAGAERCAIRVSWRDDAVKYPALLDPSWSSTVTTMTSARQEHTATLLANGKVLVAGGRSGSGTAGLATAELYDPATKTWATTGSMTGARRLHAAVRLPTSSNPTTSGKVFVTGGIDGTTSVATARLYDPAAGTWISAQNLSAARHQHTATLLASGQVLVAGGMSGTTVLNTASRYNPSSGTGTWTSVGNLAGARRAHSAALLVVPGNTTLNNRVLVVGGNSGGTTSVSTVQLFDGTSAWTTLTALSSPREGHTATALSNGNLLVTGGRNGSSTLATTLLFNAASGSGSWASAGNLGTARQAHTASLFPTSIVTNGRVLVAGGIERNERAELHRALERDEHLEFGNRDARRGAGAYGDLALDERGARRGRCERLDDAEPGASLRSFSRSQLHLEQPMHDGLLRQRCLLRQRVQRATVQRLQSDGNGRNVQSEIERDDLQRLERLHRQQ